MKKILSTLLIILMLMTFFPSSAFADQDTIECYGGTVTITDDNAYDFFHVYAPTTFVRSGDSDSYLPVSIIVNPGCHVTFASDMKLRGFTLGANAVWTSYPTLKFWDGDNKIILENDSKVSIWGEGDIAGIWVQENATVTISGTGKLTAQGAGGGAGIGGKSGEGSGNIYFEGSLDVSATGGEKGGAGIGGGVDGASGTIIVRSAYTGTMFATGGAGIVNDDISDYIKGGGAGIGGGSGGGTAGQIVLAGGTVYPKAGNRGAAAVGSGIGASVTQNILIQDCTVWADADENDYSTPGGAGIGAGYGGSIQTIEIAGSADITVLGGNKCPGIGGSEGNILIHQTPSIYAIGGGYGAGIGAGYLQDSPFISIFGGTIYSEAGTRDVVGSSGASIGGGAGGGTRVNGINISGGEIICIPKLEGAGIGAGSNTTVSGSVISGTVHDINISGGAVYIDDSGYNSIGASNDTSVGVLNLSGEFALYLRHPITCTISKPDTKIRSRLAADFIDDISGGMLYGYKYICPKTPFIAYFNVEQLSFWVHEGAPEAPKPLWMRHGGTVTLPWADKSYNYNGYAVKSWSTDQAYGNWGPGTEYAPGSSYTLTENRTLYVNWKSTLNQYTVTYLADDLTTISGETVQTVTHGQNASLVKAEGKSGTAFVRWDDGDTSSSRQDTNITADATYTSIGTSECYTLSFGWSNVDSSLDNMPEPVSGGENAVIKIPDTVPTRNLYSFTHWEINFANYLPNDDLILIHDMYAYAWWDRKPTVVNDIGSVNEGASVQIDALANDYDVEDSTQELTIGRIVTQPLHGTVQTVGGKIEYTHNGDGAVSDVFYYKVNDPYGESYGDGKVTVTITQTNDAPIVDNGIADQTAYEDALFEFTIPSDAFDDEEDDILEYSVYGLPSELSFDGTDSISGTPTNSNVGEYNITVIYTDSGGLDAQTTFKLTVDNTNDAPVIADQMFSIDENTGDGSFVALIDVDDVDSGDTITFEILSGNEAGAFEFNTTVGELTVLDSSLLNYEVHQSFVLSVQVTDTAGAKSSANVTINVNDINDLPTSEDKAITIIENEVYTFKESDFSYEDEDGDALAFVKILNQSAVGVIKLNDTPVSANEEVLLTDIQAGSLKYHPEQGASGQSNDFFQYRVNDGTDDSFDIYEITFNITPTHEIVLCDYDSSVLDKEIVIDGNKVSPPEEPSREGYTFAGWEDGTMSYKKDLSDYPAPTHDWAFVAEYDINQYTLNYVDYNGSVVKTETLDYGEKLTYPSAPGRYGYRFTGWSSDITTMPASNTTIIKAQYAVNSYTITYLNQDGSEYFSQKLKYGSEIIYPDDPDEKGYHFDGWSSSIDKMPGSNITIESEWFVAVESITMPESLSLTVGEVKTLGADVNPGNAAYKTVTWQSSNMAVAVVDKDGIVKAVGAGNSVITATADGVSAECIVEVKSEVQPQIGVVTPSSLEQTDSKVIIEIKISELPEGTKFIILPDGSKKAVDIGADTITFEIDKSFIGDKGDLEITALNDEQTPIGIMGMQIELVEQTQEEVTTTPDTAQKGSMSIFIWLAIAIAALGGVGITAYLIFRKRR